MEYMALLMEYMAFLTKHRALLTGCMALFFERFEEFGAKAFNLLVVSQNLWLF